MTCMRDIVRELFPAMLAAAGVILGGTVSVFLFTVWLSGPSEMPDWHTVIWDVQKGPDQHEYIRFAASLGSGGGCCVVHAEGCSHPDCVARRIPVGHVEAN